MEKIFFNILDYFTHNPFIIYPIIILCVATSCFVIWKYWIKVLNYYTQTVWLIIFSSLGATVYFFMHIISAKEVQTLFYMAPYQLPHTLTFLTVVLCIPAWLFLISIWIKVVNFYLSNREKITVSVSL